MDANFLKTYAERRRRLAENADEFTRRRLFDLAQTKTSRIRTAGPSAATHSHSPLNLTEMHRNR
jgi:hypothetical protein